FRARWHRQFADSLNPDVAKPGAFEEAFDLRLVVVTKRNVVESRRICFKKTTDGFVRDSAEWVFRERIPDVEEKNSAWFQNAARFAGAQRFVGHEHESEL